ncbi:MAG: thrombospondin type 3 repeat-containing protein, partial [Persicimonas sp.]
GVCRADDGLDAGADANDANDAERPDAERPDADANDAETDAPDTSDSGDADCEPRTCEDMPDRCGTLEDGCGGEVVCTCPDEYQVVLIQDITRRTAPERCIDGASPGADIMGVELQSSDGTSLSSAQHVASSINAGRFNGYKEALLVFDEQSTECVTAVSPNNMVSLGCEGRLAVIFEEPLESGRQIQVTEYGGNCGSDCADSTNCQPDVYEVRVCSGEVDDISGGDFSSCKMVLGQSSEGHTFNLTLDEEADFDGDGVADVEDNCPSVANQNQTASDRDDLGDACDNCPETENTGQEDRLGNGIGDACEVACPGRNPPSCPSDTTCRFVDPDERACFLADDRDEGAECNGDIDTCREGLQCFTNNNVSRCFRLCDGPSDCGDEDDTCVSTQFSTGTFNVCQPPCSSDAECSSGACCIDDVCTSC